MRAILDGIRLALRAIVRNPLRASLTVLGILIGVAAVVIVTAPGLGGEGPRLQPDPIAGCQLPHRLPAEPAGVRGARRAGDRRTFERRRRQSPRSRVDQRERGVPAAAHARASRLRRQELEHQPLRHDARLLRRSQLGLRARESLDAAGRAPQDEGRRSPGLVRRQDALRQGRRHRPHRPHREISLPRHRRSGDQGRGSLPEAIKTTSCSCPSRVTAPEFKRRRPGLRAS